MPQLFEFMDLPWLGRGLRETLREILDVGNSQPFRRYYDSVTNEAIQLCEEYKISALYELGAGTAPISRHVQKRLPTGNHWPKTLHPCDLHPDVASFHALEQRSGGNVVPLFESVDYFKAKPWSKNSDRSLLLLSATFHHLKFENRIILLKALLADNAHIMIAEPLRKKTSSVLFVLCSVIPALLLPLVYLRQPQRMRRILWCWIAPVAPVLFLWDGIASALRQWNPAERDHSLFTELGLEKAQVKIQTSLFCEIISIIPTSAMD